MLKAFLPKIEIDFIPHIKALPKSMPANNINIMLATWFGAGLVRPAPGTAGSLAAIPFGFAILYFGGIQSLLIAIAVLFVLGTIAATKFAKLSGKHDDKTIVVDEVVGMWIAAIPAGTHWELWVIAFVLFRIFDIKKPWPVSYFDRIEKPGFPVMMDDVVAGFLAFLGTATCALLTLG